MHPYTPEFLRSLQTAARSSARIVVPLVIDLVRPRSVIDLGCGLAPWLAVFSEHGVAQVQGVDGPHVERTLLEIPEPLFLAHDLSLPVPPLGRFDLALSLEVAEHLPPASAPVLVDSLVRHAPVVLFSAAIPFQGGEHHVNEQWPEYWASLFLERDFLVVDCIRRDIWTHPDVNWWYAQNILLFVEAGYLRKHERLRAEHAHTHHGQLSLVHPKKYLSLVQHAPT